MDVKLGLSRCGRYIGLRVLRKIFGHKRDTVTAD
jgi:hypothetical protein